MATQDTVSDHTDQPGEAPTPTTVERRHGIIERYRERGAERKRARRISPRNRRLIARWLRRTATHAHEPHPLARRRETLLHYRVAAVRTDLLEIAALLEHAHAPDPACVAELHDLLANGCDSPLYNPDIHISELQATLHYVRTGLAPIATRDPHPTRHRLTNRSSAVADSASQANASRTPSGTDQRRLALLANWRSGALATAIVMAGVLPFAIAWRVNDLIAVAASIIFAAILAISTHLARRRWLATMALSPELVQLPDLAAERRRLQSARTRRALAVGLRRTADPIQPPRRFDPCPVLPDRAAAVRDQLLELANALEQTQTPDPACVALIRELLTNGTGPLYNPNLPAGDLQTTLTRARAGITAQPTA